MLKVLLSVDGSMSATHATQKLVETLELYNEQPEVDVLAVHLPVPRYGISDDTRERYYQEKCEGMLAACKKILDAAGVKYTVHTCVGEIAEMQMKPLADHVRILINMLDAGGVKG